MNRETKKQLIVYFILFVFVGSALSFAVIYALPGSGPGKEYVHWHAQLNIIINGEEITIPANVGIPVDSGNNVHPEVIHTHATDNILHKEGPADLTLGNFFDVWDRTFSSECIFDFCNSEEGTVKMYVNGQPNTEFGDYIFKDNDIIAIEYG